MPRDAIKKPAPAKKKKAIAPTIRANEDDLAIRASGDDPTIRMNDDDLAIRMNGDDPTIRVNGGV